MSGFLSFLAEDEAGDQPSVAAGASQPPDSAVAEGGQPAAAAPQLALQEAGHAAAHVHPGRARARGRKRKRPAWENELSVEARRHLWSMRLHDAKRKKAVANQNKGLSTLMKQLRPSSRCKKLVTKRSRRGQGAIQFAIVRTGRDSAEPACQPEQYLDAAFRSPPNATHAALQVGVQPRTVVRMRHLMAEFILESQLLLIGALVMLTSIHRPLICITREAWDETGHLCLFRTDSDQSASECRSRWEIMVLRVSLCLVWHSSSGLQPLFMEFVVPPVVIPSTSAANMYYSLRYHPAFAKFQSALAILRSHARLKGYLLETDAAYANEKLIAYFLMNAPSTVDHLIAWKCCHSHKNMHVENMVLASVNKTLLGKLYSMCAFLHSGTNWARLQRRIKVWAREASGLSEEGRPSRASLLLAAAIASVVRDSFQPLRERGSARQCRWVHGWGKQGDGRTAAKIRAHTEKAEKLETYLRETYNCLDSSPIVHKCPDQSCCAIGCVPIHERLAKGLRDLVFPRAPAPPAAGKWTKLAPALNTILLGVVLRAWEPLLEAAFGDQKCAEYAEGDDDEAAAATDERSGEMDWQKLSGIRYKKTKQLVSDIDTQVSIIIIAVCLEPVRHITQWFIECSSDTRDLRRPPPFLDTIFAPASPLTAALQYLASLYFDSHREGCRWWLLTAWLGFTSPEQHFAGVAQNICAHACVRMHACLYVCMHVCERRHMCACAQSCARACAHAGQHGCVGGGRHMAALARCGGAALYLVHVCGALMRRGAQVLATMPFVTGDTASWRKARAAIRATMCFIWRKHVHELQQYPWKLLGLGDPRMEPMARQALINDFGATKACCLPRGLARSAQIAQVDLASDVARQFMYWFAFMTRMTVADVEVRHARNNHTSGYGHAQALDFSSIVAQYIIAEYATMRSSSIATGWRARHTDASANGEASRAACEKKRITDRRRGKTMLQCYAADRPDLKHLRTAKGRMTEEYWAQLRAGMRQLTEERRAIYSEQSRISCLAAKDKMRQSRSLASLGASADSPQDPANAQLALPAPAVPVCDLPKASIVDNALLTMNMIPPSILAQHSSPRATTPENCDRCLQSIQLAQGQLVQHMEAYATSDEQVIVRNLVDESELRAFISKVPVKARARTFQANTRRVGRPRNSADVFPEKVVYPQCCRPVCKLDTDRYGIAHHVLDMLAITAKRCGSPSRVPTADMLLCLEVSSASKPADPVYSFWWMLGASFQSGHHWPTQTFWRCFPADPLRTPNPSKLDVGGMSLCIEMCGEVQLQAEARAPPPCTAQHAMPRFYDQDQLARYVLCDIGDRKSPVVSRFAIKKLQFQEQRDNTITVLREDDSFEPLTLAGRLAAAKPKPKPAAKCATEPASESRGSNMLDWMGLLLDDEAAPAQPGARTPRTQPPATSSTSASSRSSAPASFAATEEVALQELAAVLGLEEVAVPEEGWMDKKVLAGLLEEVGADVFEELYAFHHELEEDDEQQWEFEEQQAEAAGGTASAGASAPSGDNGDENAGIATTEGTEDVGEASAAPMAPEIEAPAGFLGPKQTKMMQGMVAQITGYNHGAAMHLSQPAADGAGSSTAMAPGRSLGVLHRVNAGGLKMTCKTHTGCSCWVTMRKPGGSAIELANELVDWIAIAKPTSAKPASWAEHQSAAKAIKIKYGMRIR